LDPGEHDAEAQRQRKRRKKGKEKGNESSSPVNVRESHDQGSKSKLVSTQPLTDGKRCQTIQKKWVLRGGNIPMREGLEKNEKIDHTSVHLGV